MKKTWFMGVLSLVGALLVSCGSANRSSEGASTGDGWEPLFDGVSLDGWRGFNRPGPVDNWVVEDGVLTCLGKTGGADIGGDIVTEREFGNFELEWEWKISPKGNSGLMYHVVEDTKYKAPYETGPEYQLIDDAGFGSQLEKWQEAGANYAMNVADDAKKKLSPVGEWNLSRVVYRDGDVEHWLNGELIVAFSERTPEWNQEKNEGKWKDFPDYKIADKGKIALQDHGDRAWFRNMRIKEL